MKDLFAKLNKVFSLNQRERNLYFHITFWLCRIELLRRLYSFPALRKKFTRLYFKKKPENLDIGQVCMAVDRISYVLSFKCLTKALTGLLLLKNNEDINMIFGVSITNGFEAHAWLELNGKVILGDLPDSKFKSIWKWA